MVGRSRAGFIRRHLGRSLSDALSRRAELVGVYVVTGEQPQNERPRTKGLGERLGAIFGPRLSIGLLAAIVSVAAAVGIGELLTLVISLPNVSMIFLTAVLFCAVQFGLRSAIAAAILSFFAYDFFFIPPLYMFTIAEPQEFFALGIFLIVAFLVGWLAGRARDQERLARENAQTTRSLFELSRKLSGAVALDDILLAATVYAQKTLAARCVVMLLPEEVGPGPGVGLAAVGRAQPGRDQRRALGLRKGRGGRLEDGHAAEHTISVSSAA